MDWLIIYCLFSGAWGFLCKSMAESRGRDLWTGFWCGFLFWLPAVIVYACLGKTKTKRRQEIRDEVRWRKEAEEEYSDEECEEEV